MFLKVRDKFGHFWMYGGIERIHWFCWTPKENEGDQSDNGEETAIPHPDLALLNAVDPAFIDRVQYAIYFKQNGRDPDLVLTNIEAYIMNDDGKTIEILRSA